MVGTGDPAGVISLHPLQADVDVLNCIVKDMSHMQNAGNIRRGYYYSIRLFCFINLRMKNIIIEPVFIPFILNLGGGIRFWDFLSVLLIHFAEILLNKM